MFRLVFKNAGWMALAEIFNRIFAFLLTIAIVRAYTPSEFGQLKFAMAFAVIFSVITDFGLTNLTIREVSRNKEKVDKFIGKTFSLKILLNIIALAIIVLLANLTVQNESQILLLYLAGVNNFLASLSGSFLGIFVAFDMMRFNALARLLRGATLIFLGYLVIFSGLPIAWVLGAHITSSLVALIVAIFSTTTKITRIYFFSFDWKFSKWLFFESWPFAVAATFPLISFSLDSVMLGYLGFIEEVAWYGAALTLVTIPLTLRRFFRRSLIPTLSKYIFTSRDKVTRIVFHFKKLFVFLALPLGVGTTILAPEIMVLLFGDQYVSGVVALRILIWGVVFSFLNLSQHEVLVAANRQKLSMIILVSAGLLNVLLNLILIPQFGLVGATVSTSLAFFLSLVLASYFANQLIKTNFLALLPKPLFASIVMGGVLFYFTDLSLFFLSALGFGVYIGIIVLLKFFTPKEIKFARSFVSGLGRLKAYES